MTLWIGEEQEGEYKGLKTLFIKGIYSYSELYNYVVTHKPQQLYFGAGLCSFFDLNVMRKLKEEFDIIITVETLIENNYIFETEDYDKFNIIFTINTVLKNNIKNIQIKIQDLEAKKLFMYNLDKFIYTDLSTLNYDKYENDVVLKW